MHRGEWRAGKRGRQGYEALRTESDERGQGWCETSARGRELGREGVGADVLKRLAPWGREAKKSPPRGQEPSMPGVLAAHESTLKSACGCSRGAVARENAALMPRLWCEEKGRRHRRG